MDSSTEMGLLDCLSQSCEQIRASTSFGVKELLKLSRTRPPVLNADSEATVEMGTANTSLAIRERTGNLSLLSFHHRKTSIPSSSTIASLR